MRRTPFTAPIGFLSYTLIIIAFFTTHSLFTIVLYGLLIPAIISMTIGVVMLSLVNSPKYTKADKYARYFLGVNED